MSDRITLVIPAYNEVASLALTLPAACEALEQTHTNWDIIVVDDGSSDGTAQWLHDLASRSGWLTPMIFTRNFGKEAAILAGLEAATGDAVIVLDADMQHPPKLIPQMVRLWRQGISVVEAVKCSEHDQSPLDRGPSGLFNRLFSRISGVDLTGRCDYKLLDRRVVNAYCALPERRRFFRGLIAWFAFPSAILPFSVPPRSDGSTSRWSVWQLTRYAIDNLTGFSTWPLALIGFLGALILIVGGVSGTVALYMKLAGTALDGFTTVIILITLVGGGIMLSLGIVGLYLARLYEEVKYRPIYMLREPPQNPHREPR